MKKLSLFIFVITFFMYLPAFPQTNLIGPPNGLEYGMSYSEAKAALKSNGIKMKKLKHEKKMRLPKGFKIAKVDKYKIMERKTDTNLACFNADGELCAFQINFRWTEDDRSQALAKANQFWERQLEKPITAKYSGEGFINHTDPDPDGNIPVLAFRPYITMV